MTDLLYVGDHPVPLASGRTVVPGEEIPADALTSGEDNVLDPHDQRLLDERLLITPAGDEPLRGEALDARADELDIEGRSEMSAQQLRRAVAKAERDQAKAAAERGAAATTDHEEG